MTTYCFVCPKTGDVLGFLPTKSFCESKNFDGVLVNEPDTRPLRELQADPKVRGLIIKEGGCGVRILNGAILQKYADVELRPLRQV